MIFEKINREPRLCVMCERTNSKQRVLIIWAVGPYAGQPRHDAVDFSTATISAVQPRMCAPVSGGCI